MSHSERVGAFWSLRNCIISGLWCRAAQKRSLLTMDTVRRDKYSRGLLCLFIPWDGISTLAVLHGIRNTDLTREIPAPSEPDVSAVPRWAARLEGFPRTMYWMMGSDGQMKQLELRHLRIGRGPSPYRSQPLSGIGTYKNMIVSDNGAFVPLVWLLG